MRSREIRKPSFDELRHQRRVAGGSSGLNGGGLFESEWEVFVARYDPDSGKYVSRTVCCETALISAE